MAQSHPNTLIAEPWTRLPEPRDRLVAESCAFAIITWLRGRQAEQHRAAGPQAQDLGSEPLRRMIAFLESHHSESLSPRHLAAAAGLPARSAARLFRRPTGLAPSAFLTAVRVRAAGDLLRTTARPVTDIALVCGCSDATHPTRHFVRAHGVPPARWRRRRSA